MRLQSLISVIVSLRSSESEWRWCGFTPRGGKQRRSQKPLSDSRSKALELRGAPTLRSDQWASGSSRPSNRNSQSRRGRGGPWSRCCASNVGLRSDRLGKKGKVTQERKKLMVVVHDRRGGGLYFTINRIAEILWPQTAPDKLLVDFFWTERVISKLGFIRLRHRSAVEILDDTQRSALRDQGWSFRHYSCGT